MTFEEYMRNELENNGMFGSQIDSVMCKVKEAPENESMADRWHENTSNYPDIMVDVVWLGVRSSALDWIDTNLPQAWFRQMFV